MPKTDFVNNLNAGLPHMSVIGKNTGMYFYCETILFLPVCFAV